MKDQTDIYDRLKKSKCTSFSEEHSQRSGGHSLSCQTSWHDATNSSPLRITLHNDSNHSSRSEIPHSLNNFVSAEAAISDDQNSTTSRKRPFQQHSPRSFQSAISTANQTLSDSRTKLFEQGETSVTTVTNAHNANATNATNNNGNLMQTGHSRRPHNVIQIERNSLPVVVNINRQPPLFMRIWNIVASFFGAICLCLQVNRDCIFCLGFFAAFVVSASFLTAFFYRTLSVSSSTLRSTNNNGPIQDSMLMDDFNGNFRQTSHI